MLHYYSYYKGYTEEQFAADEYFQQWVVSPDTENNHFWQSYLDTYPEQSAVVFKALELVKELGADEVIDYTAQDMTTLVNNVDLVADCAGGEAQSKLFEVLKSGGKLLSIAGMPSPELAQKYNIEARFVSSNLSAKSLENGLNLVREGKIKPIIAKTFPLAQAAQAQDFVSAGGMNGKVVLEVG